MNTSAITPKPHIIRKKKTFTTEISVVKECDLHNQQPIEVRQPCEEMGRAVAHAALALISESNRAHDCVADSWE